MVHGTQKGNNVNDCYVLINMSLPNIQELYINMLWCNNGTDVNWGGEILNRKYEKMCGLWPNSCHGKSAHSIEKRYASIHTCFNKWTRNSIVHYSLSRWHFTYFIASWSWIVLTGPQKDMPDTGKWFMQWVRRLWISAT
jgi:hypothetical protein